MGEKMRVLLADDTEDMRLMMRVVFEADGRFEVVGEAEDGSQAIDLCEELRPDAVLLDLRMPVMAGDEALPHLRDTCPEAAIVVFTAHASDSTLDVLIAAGASAVVSKSARPSAVVETVARAAR